MWRVLSIALSGIVLLGLVAGLAGSIGYLAHRGQIDPLYGLAERAITKGRRELGLPTETVAKVARIETTYLTFRGTTYLMPENDFRNGGGLTLWGQDVLVLHQSGRILMLDKNTGLKDTDITVPNNGKAAYAELTARKYPDRWNRIDTIRFNDIEFVDQPSFRGLLLSYTYIDAEAECYRSRVSKLDIPASVNSIRDLNPAQSDWQVVFETSPCLAFNPTREMIVGYMAGGRLAYKEPGLIYLGSGEYHLDGLYRPDAGIQSDESDYGKTIEINVLNGEYRHYSKGHRNLQGVELDKLGRLWTTEHGMRGGDELNLIKDGENYGWPLENLGTLYNTIPAPTEGRIGRHDIYAPPVYAWLPSAAVSSLALVDGFHETWDGDLIIGSLRGQTLFRARIRGDRLVFMEQIPIGERIRDVMQVGPEQLALWMDTNELVILEIEHRSDPMSGLMDGLVETGMAPDLAQEAQDVLVGCNECHSFEEFVHGAGPSLFKIASQGVATTAFGNYSDELRAVGGTWDRDRLAAFITDPDSLAEGTGMSGFGLGTAELAGAVADALVWLDAQSTASGEDR